MQLMDMTWPDIQAYVDRRKRALAILPAGSVEQHSLCMPIGTDAYIAKAIAAAVGDKTNGVVFPVVRPGLSAVPHMAFPGTITHTSTTLITAIVEILRCAHEHGFRDFFVLNAHGLNSSPLACALQDAALELDDSRFVLQDWWALPDIAALLEARTTPGGHATAGELSLMLHLHPELVNDQRLGRHEIKHSYWLSLDRVSDLTESGMVGGNQLEADSALGAELFRLAVEGCCRRIHEFSETET